MSVHSRTLAFVFSICILTTSGLLAKGEKQNEPVGPMTVTPNMVQWTVIPQHESVDLTVMGPDGDVFSASFAGGPPSFKMNDLKGKSNLDGTYIYELRIVPRIPESVKQALKAARAHGDDAAVKQIRKQAGIETTIVQSGAFSIVNGSFMSPDLDEGPGAASTRTAAPQAMLSAGDGGSSDGGGSAPIPARHLRPAPNDQVIADDLIVQGSECVGLDCVNNESFGFDTLRLKENNDRIKFDDTSTSSGFPSTDWQLTANDSASGGASKFSVEDITDGKVPFTIIGNAPTNAMFIDSSGRVGIGTATPVLNLHENKSDTPAIRLEQNNSGGFSAQTWDIGANEANFFVRDVTGGSRLPFRIRPGAPTSSIDISAAGNVGIGTASPQRKLHLVGPSGPVPTFPSAQIGPQDVALFENNGNDNVTILGGATSQSTIRFVRDAGTTFGFVRYILNTDDLAFGTAGIERMRIDSAGNIGIGVTPTQPIQHSNGAFLSAGGVWTNASSRALKQDICDLDSAQAESTLKQMTPVTYAYKIAPDEHHAGFIAEDVPNLVASTNHKGMSAMDVAAVLTKVVQDQQKTIEELKKRVEALEKNR